jgi:hypothetical protein
MKRRAVTVTGFAVHGCAKSHQRGRGLEISRALIHFRSLISANGFLDYAYQDSRPGGPTNFRKGLPAPDFFRVTTAYDRWIETGSARLVSILPELTEHFDTSCSWKAARIWSF